MLEVTIFSDGPGHEQIGAFSIRQELEGLTDEQIGAFIRMKIAEAANFQNSNEG